MSHLPHRTVVACVASGGHQSTPATGGLGPVQAETSCPAIFLSGGRIPRAHHRQPATLWFCTESPTPGSLWGPGDGCYPRLRPWTKRSGRPRGPEYWPNIFQTALRVPGDSGESLWVENDLEPTVLEDWRGSRRRLPHRQKSPAAEAEL